MRRPAGTGFTGQPEKGGQRIMSHEVLRGLPPVIACLLLSAAGSSAAADLPSGTLGGETLDAAVLSHESKDYLYYELDRVSGAFDCSGSIALSLPPSDTAAGGAQPVNLARPLVVIRSGGASIGEGCRIGPATGADGTKQAFDVLLKVSGESTDTAEAADPLAYDGGRSGVFRLTGPSGTFYLPPGSTLSQENEVLANLLSSDSADCTVSGISMAGSAGKCSNSILFTARGSGQCSWTLETSSGSGWTKAGGGTADFDNAQSATLRAANTNGSLRSVRIKVGSCSRTFDVSGTSAGLSLAITKDGGGSGAKIAGKKAVYRVGVKDAAGNDCPGIQLTGMKAGLLRSTDNGKSGVRALVNGKEIGFVASSSEALPTDISLSGSSLDFDYLDFGRTTLYISGTAGGPGSGSDGSGADDEAATLRGSAEISSWPQGICVRYSRGNANKLCSGGCELLPSGEEFLLDILPVAYSGSDGDPLACSDASVGSRVLPSFRMKDIPLLRSISRVKAENAPDPAEDRDLPAEIETLQGSGDTAVSGKFDYGSEGSLLPDGMKLRARIGSAGTFRAHIPSIEFAGDLRSAESWSEELSWIYPYAYRIWWADGSSSESFAKSLSFCRKSDSGTSKYPWFTYTGQPFRLRYARIEALNRQGGVIRNYDSSIFSHATDVPRLMPFAREGTGFMRSSLNFERLPETDASAVRWQGWTDGRLYTLDSSSAPVMTHDYYFRLSKDGLKAPLTLYAGVGMESGGGAGRAVVCGQDGNGERFSAAAPLTDGAEGAGTEVSAPDEFCAFGGRRDHAAMNFLTGRVRAVPGRTGSEGVASVPFVAEYVSEIDESGSAVWAQNYPDSCTVLSFGRDAESPFSFSERIVSESSVKDTAAVSPVRKAGTEHDASDAFTVTPQGGIPFSINFSGTYRGKIENSESAVPESSVFARMRNGTAVLRLILNGNFEDYGARRADFRYVLKRSTIGPLKDTETDTFDLKSAESPLWLGDTVIGSVIFGGRVVSPRMIYLQDGN